MQKVKKAKILRALVAVYEYALKTDTSRRHRVTQSGELLKMLREEVGTYAFLYAVPFPEHAEGLAKAAENILNQVRRMEGAYKNATAINRLALLEIRDEVNNMVSRGIEEYYGTPVHKHAKTLSMATGETDMNKLLTKVGTTLGVDSKRLVFQFHQLRETFALWAGGLAGYNELPMNMTYEMAIEEAASIAEKRNAQIREEKSHGKFS